MRILLRLIAVLVSIVLLSTGCTKYLTAKPQSVSNDPNQIAGMPVKDGPSGLRSGVPALTQDVVNTDDGEIDRLAATAVGDIQELVRHLTSRGIGVLITDHNVRETLKLTDRAYVIYDGQVLTQGKPQEIINNEDVRRVYLGDSFV